MSISKGLKLPIHYEHLTPSMKRQVRNAYVEQQGGDCYYCKSSLTSPPPAEVTDLYVDRSYFPKSFFKYPVHLHHSHETGLTIGTVHNYCNAVLWQYHGE